MGQTDYAPPLDKTGGHTVHEDVTSRLYSIIAVLLLAIWLPVTQHCGLEAAGLLVTAIDCHDTSDCASDHDQTTCGTDGCQIVEDGSYKSNLDTLTLLPPVLSALTCLCCLHDITPETIIVSLISPARSDAPPELAPTWQFTSRAAPSPRAPGYLA